MSDFFSGLLNEITNPKNLVPGIFTLGGAFIGTYLSGKFAYRLAKTERLDRKKETYLEFIHVLERMDSLVVDRIYEHRELTMPERIEVNSFLNTIETKNFVSDFKKVKIPPTIRRENIDGLLKSIDNINNFMGESRFDLINSQLSSYKLNIKIMISSYYQYLY